MAFLKERYIYPVSSSYYIYSFSLSTRIKYRDSKLGLVREEERMNC